MPTKPLDRGLPTEPVAEPLSMRELAAVLVKHYGLHEGHYTLVVEFQVGTGPVGPDRENLTPGAMLGVSKVGLMPTKEADGVLTVDAKNINPTTTSKSRKRVSGG